jgi:hypothetical protein
MAIEGITKRKQHGIEAKRKERKHGLQPTWNNHQPTSEAQSPLGPENGGQPIQSLERIR